jgi:hypothetical protein
MRERERERERERTRTRVHTKYTRNALHKRTRHAAVGCAQRRHGAALTLWWHEHTDTTRHTVLATHTRARTHLSRRRVGDARLTRARARPACTEMSAVVKGALPHLATARRSPAWWCSCTCCTADRTARTDAAHMSTALPMHTRTDVAQHVPLVAPVALKHAPPRHTLRRKV